MQVKTPEAVTLIKLQTVSFVNAKKETVEYREFSILDENNDIIEGTCRKTVEMPDLVKGDSVNGIAVFDVVPTKDNAKNTKVKLVSFND